jgi:serine-type D-Ala-D-Ala carboxypeptidase (penicillin-binding protein 5/6)
MRTLIVVAGFLSLLFCTSSSGAQNAGDAFPRVAASYLLELNGQSLWAHRPTAKLPPASLTKIMTALLVLERGRLDEVVTISLTASQETGTRLGLRRGEKVKSDFLLAATLLMSANDACRALAEHIGGHEPGFVALMNRRAKELGMEGTRFSNASGHDHDGHYSCARDLAILSGAALKHPAFTEQVKRVSAYIATVEGRSFYFENKNELIGRYPGAVGVKTGFTPKAGKCLVALAERDGSKALLVLLNAPNRWWDAEDMLNEAFRPAKKADSKP